MGFKADTSFLRFLTMGALGVKQVIEQLTHIGFHPIELERYCASNKIWTTKVKRLRLPDLLCVNTGVRIEVRAKTDLKIRMSHAEKNPDRYWDAGLQPEDLIAFIVCNHDSGVVTTAESGIFFLVADLQEKIDTAKFGPPKSASEGAERDLTWPCTVPKKNGVVISADSVRIRTMLDEGRRQTYSIKGKVPYVSAGDKFAGNESIIAGSVSKPIDPSVRLTNTWNPFDLLHSPVEIDRYAATKSLPFLEPAVWNKAVTTLESLIDAEIDERVALEMGSSLSKMNSAKGFDFLINKIVDSNETYIPMEVVFILTEIANSNSITELLRIASTDEFSGNEIRQAAVWGLGKAGAKAYDRVVQFIDDEEDDVALHAIASFGLDTEHSTIDELIHLLVSGSERQRASSCEALRLTNSNYAVGQLALLAEQKESERSWIVASLGQFPPDIVRTVLQGNPLLDHVQPFFLLSNEENWLASDTKVSDRRFLLGQNIY